MARLGEILARIGEMSYGMAELQLKDVTPAMFARKPNLGGREIDTNHPAFVYGHLAIYPTMLMGMLGLDAAKAPKPAGFDELFSAGKPCLDDPSGTIYPAMDTIVKVFMANHRVLLDALPGVPDATFAGDNPREQSRKRFPTVGDAVGFMVGSHMMMHLGQVSAWRRCMGLGPVM